MVLYFIISIGWICGKAIKSIRLIIEEGRVKKEAWTNEENQIECWWWLMKQKLKFIRKKHHKYYYIFEIILFKIWLFLWISELY